MGGKTGNFEDYLSSSRELLHLIMNSQTLSLVEVLRAIKIIHQYYYKRTPVQSKSSLDTPINYLHLGKNQEFLIENRLTSCKIFHWKLFLDERIVSCAMLAELAVAQWQPASFTEEIIFCNVSQLSSVGARRQCLLGKHRARLGQGWPSECQIYQSQRSSQELWWRPADLSPDKHKPSQGYHLSPLSSLLSPQSSVGSGSCSD